jgi:HK97 family phage major capsid protein
MEENVKQQLDQLGNLIDAKIEKANGQVLENAKGQIDSVLKGEIDNLTKSFNERVDAIEMQNKKNLEASQAKKSFKSQLIEVIKNGALDGMIKGHARAASFEVKADMTTAADFTGEVIPADRVAGYKYDPARSVHVRSIIPNGTTSSDVVRFVKESGYSDGSAAKAEGATLGQSDFDLTATDANVQKIGAYFRVSEEMLADTPAISSYISTRAAEKLMTEEDDQILNGNGTAPNLSGIVTDSADFVTGSGGSFYQSVEAANEFDVLVAALNQLALSEYQANYIMLHPTDFHKILLLKDTQNNYLKDQVYAGLQPNFMGVPVIINTAITAGTFLLGNFAVGTQLWTRDNLSVEFFREDGTNVRDGFVTAVVKERIALTNYLPNAFVNGTFSTAKAALETP